MTYLDVMVNWAEGLPLKGVTNQSSKRFWRVMLLTLKSGTDALYSSLKIFVVPVIELDGAQESTLFDKVGNVKVNEGAKQSGSLLFAKIKICNCTRTQ